jgi:HEAT repeat protein
MMLLIEMKYEGALDLILQLLESQDPSERLAAIQKLGKLGDKKATPHLLGHVHTADFLMQAEVIRALGELGAIEAAPILVSLLVDDELYGPRTGVYHAVTEAFQKCSGITEEIHSAFPGKYPAMFNMGGASMSLPEAMGLLGNNPGGNLLQDTFSRLQSGIPKDVELPSGIPANIINKAFEGMAWKFGVMFADARDASQERVRRLTELLKSESSLRRAAAALTLPWYTNEESLGALEAAMRDADEVVRKAATWAYHALQKAILYRRQLGM